MCPECRIPFTHIHRRQLASGKNIYDVRININRPHSPLSRNLWAFFPKRKCFRVKRFTADSHDMISFESMISTERKPYQRPRGMSCGSWKTSRVNNSIPFPSMSGKSIAESLSNRIILPLVLRCGAEKNPRHKGNTENNKIIKSMIRLFSRTASDVTVRRDEGFNHRVNILPFYSTYDTWKEDGATSEGFETRRRIYRSKILA